MKDMKRVSGNNKSQDADIDDSNSYEDNEVAVALEPEVGDILEKLDPDEQELIGTMISYSGPLPPPEYLKGYVEVYPEAADRIFGWVDAQEKHRHEMEKIHLNRTFNHSRLGMIGGIIISIIFIVLSFILIILEKESLGLVFIGSYIVSIVAIVVRKKSQNKTADKNKDEKEDKE